MLHVLFCLSGVRLLVFRVLVCVLKFLRVGREAYLIIVRGAKIQGRGFMSIGARGERFDSSAFYEKILVKGISQRNHARTS